MKKFKSVRLTVLVALAFLFSNILPAIAGNFVATEDGIRYVYKTNKGITKYVTPKYDSSTGTYYVTNSNNEIIARQQLKEEAAMEQIRIVSTTGNSTQDFMGNDVRILTPLATSDPRYQYLKHYIENNKSLQKTFAMHYQARDYKIQKIRQEVGQGVKDQKLASWLTNDLKKPVYLEVDSSGMICHDSAGFVLAEAGSNGRMTYRDNSYANRIVISENSEVFAGNPNNPTTSSIISHEVGHMIMDQLYETPNYPRSNYYGSHSKNTISDEGFAISEGWAEAIESLSTKEYRAKNGTSDSWRLKTHQNIEDNNYIYKDAAVTNVVNNGLLKTSGEMLSTEGVNASLFYDMLSTRGIQNSYSKICTVFEESKPQTYRDFVYDYINKYPEDRTTVTKMFLENTKYTTIDSSAAARYKELFDAEQAYLNATDYASKMNLKNVYEAKREAYENYNESLYRQACVDGTIDSAVSINDRTASDYRNLRLSENWLKTRNALDSGVKNAGKSIKNSFSAKNMAMTAGTSIAINLASQLMKGEKVSVKNAVKAVASMEFAGNFIGSSLGAAAGQVVVPLVQTFVPGIVGTLAGALIPSITSLVGGNIGGGLGSGKGLKEAIKSVDLLAVSGQAIGSTLGSMLGSLIPVPIIGTMLGGIVGGLLGEKIFTKIRSLFSKKEKASTNKSQLAEANKKTIKAKIYEGNYDLMEARISDSLETLDYSSMPDNLKTLKNEYENAYKLYVDSVISGNQTKAAHALKSFRAAKAAYELALKSVK